MLLQLAGVKLQLPICVLELVLEVGAGTDVDDRGDHERTVPPARRREADLDPELRAVTASSCQLQTIGHRTGRRVEAILGPVRGVSVAEARRHEAFDRFSEQLLG